MANLITTIDELGSTILFDRLATLAGPQTTSGSGQWWMFATSYTMTATLDPGPVDLIVHDTIRITEFTINWKLQAVLSLDLNKILPPVYLPKITIKITWKKWKLTISISITWVHYPWPTVNVPLVTSNAVYSTVDLQLIVRSDSANWYVLAKITGVPVFNFGPVTAAVIAAVGLALPTVLAPVPLIGPFMAIAIGTIMTGLAVAGVAGLLAPPISQLLQGREFMLYQRPRNFQVLPYVDANDPDVNVQITMVEASIVNTGEDELRILVNLKD